MMNTISTIHTPLSYDEVVWYDSDASEDEDYVPQHPHHSSTDYFMHPIEDTDILPAEDRQDRKRGRMNSLSWDINTREYFRRKLGSMDTAHDKIRKAIDKTVDNGTDKVDLSQMGLEEIPDEMSELQYVTVLSHDVIKPASLQLYLYGNQIHTLNATLFGLKYLTVLSLRNNKLTSIPPEIALLENLQELSLGNNQLTLLPAELLRLNHLKTLSLFPNSFLTNHGSQTTHNHTSLVEIASRLILRLGGLNMVTQSTHIIQSYIPDRILHQFNMISHINYCENCTQLFHQPTVEEIVWVSILNSELVPVNYRFCSYACSVTYSTRMK